MIDDQPGFIFFQTSILHKRRYAHTQLSINILQSLSLALSSMGTNPFPIAPDAMFLKLDMSTKNLLIQNFESEWGLTDERLCYFDDVLIGLASDTSTDGKQIYISLLPKLDSTRQYPWPDRAMFILGMTKLLSTSKDWLLICERDADQNKLKHINGLEETLIALNTALAFSAGEPIHCPTFSASSQI
ncbi:hypothetical protein ACO0LF_27985 [Undibacterium sp. Di27W]|uniref:hypothetical protein n=1 Tax=Undibacterium sp. Di27W TaxID=3413036 RepID=UPI003BF418F5